MRRLSGVDADMLYAETPEWHMHVGGVVIVDPSTAPGGFGYDEWRALMGHLALQVPAFHERLVEVPLGLDRPVWVRDPDFDLDNHLHTLTLGSPGDRRDLADLVGELSRQKLDRSRPLWEAWYIDGLQDGRVSSYFKLHHALMDGVGGTMIMGHMLSLEPDGVDITDEPAFEGEPLPSGANLVLGAAGSLLSIPLRAARLLPRTVGSLRNALTRRERGSADSAALPFRAPRTPFNYPVTANRAIAFCSLPLADAKTVRKAFDATINDVVLAVCAGALRRWLAGQGRLPDSPLVAAVPVSTRTIEQMEELGNRVSGWFATLATNIDDPVERLRLVRKGAAGAKDLYESGIEDVVMDWADLPIPLMMTFGTRLYDTLKISERVPPVFNLLVSNIRGADTPLYAGGAQVDAIYPLGPVLDSVGLNMTVLSYQDSIDFAIVGCPDLSPDLWDLADALPLALAELVEAIPAAQSD